MPGDGEAQVGVAKPVGSGAPSVCADPGVVRGTRVVEYPGTEHGNPSLRLSLRALRRLHLRDAFDQVRGALEGTYEGF